MVLGGFDCFSRWGGYGFGLAPPAGDFTLREPLPGTEVTDWNVYAVTTQRALDQEHHQVVGVRRFWPGRALYGGMMNSLQDSSASQSALVLISLCMFGTLC